MPQSWFLIGLDLGQAQDPSALAVLEQIRPAPEADASYAIRELRRWPLGTAYPDLVAEVVRLTRTPQLAGQCELVIDGTGCGRAVVDLFRRAEIDAAVRPILITAGQAVTEDEQGYIHVAKVQLVSVMQVLLGTRRMRFVRKLPLTPVLERELSTFTAKITTAGNEIYATDWRLNPHDDLVLAAAIAAWVGENIAIGPFTVTLDKGSRYLIGEAPEGVFHTDGRRSERRGDDPELDVRWPW